jgi:transcriptional regulator with XRE-family HTH domain
MFDINLPDGSDAVFSARRPTDIDRVIGIRIRRFRRFYKVTQVRAAEAIGVSYPQMQKYETGINRVTLTALIRLSRAFGIPPQEFLAYICTDIETDQPPNMS